MHTLGKLMIYIPLALGAWLFVTVIIAAALIWLDLLPETWSERNQAKGAIIFTLALEAWFAIAILLINS